MAGHRHCLRKLEVPEYQHCIGGGGGHQEVILRQPGGRAVVIGDAILAEHEAVPHLANRQRGKRVGVDPVQEFRGIAPLNVDLAECGHVADAD